MTKPGIVSCSARSSSDTDYTENRKDTRPGRYTIQLGINRNKPMFAGQSQYWFWGPWEVIDGNVLSDPYGIESQIR